jgi:hypothetical protein
MQPRHDGLLRGRVHQVPEDPLGVVDIRATRFVGLALVGARGEILRTSHR